eukprot:UN28662
MIVSTSNRFRSVLRWLIKLVQKSPNEENFEVEYNAKLYHDIMTFVDVEVLQSSVCEFLAGNGSMGKLTRKSNSVVSCSSLLSATQKEIQSLRVYSGTPIRESCSIARTHVMLPDTYVCAFRHGFEYETIPSKGPIQPQFATYIPNITENALTLALIEYVNNGPEPRNKKKKNNPWKNTLTTNNFHPNLECNFGQRCYCITITDLLFLIMKLSVCIT